MSNQRENALRIISQILLDHFEIQIADTENNLDTPLTQLPFRLDSISLTYFFLLLNDSKDIRLSSFDIYNYNFTTINKILNMIFEEKDDTAAVEQQTQQSSI